MKRTVAAFTVLGVPVKIDLTWIFIALFFAWSLASGAFPQLYAGLPNSTYWLMALFAVAGLGLSIIVHELAHTLVGRALGMRINGITLFFFGGAAELAEEPRSAWRELAMALAGPGMSLVVAGVFILLGQLAGGAAGGVQEVLRYLATLNLVLAIFNLMPAFPLDGGRVLRAVLWLVSGDGATATRRAAKTGEFLGLVLMALGLVATLAGEVSGGLWWLFIGWFIRSMAAAERTEVDARRLLAGLPVRAVMTPAPDLAQAGWTVERFVGEELVQSHHDFYPVVADGRLVGLLEPRALLRTPRADWPGITLGELCAPVAGDDVIDPSLDAAAALEAMRRRGRGRLVIVERGRVTGLLTLVDLLHLLRIRQDFEPQGGRA